MTAALDAIRDLAEAATPGPWYIERDGWVRVKLEDGLRVTVCSTADDRYLLERSKPDAAYIAAVDPQTVLGILAALDRAEAVVVDLKAVVADKASLTCAAARRKALGEAIEVLTHINTNDRASYVVEAAIEKLVALRAYEDADKVADG